MLKEIRKTIFKYIQPFRWRSQARKVRAYGINLSEKLLLEGKMDDILIIAPHPDDELIGCYNAIRSCRGKVCLYYSGLTGDDKTSENKRIRTNEFLSFSEKMRADSYVEDSYHLDVLKGLLQKRFSYVFIPTIVDWHKEHRELSRKVLSLLEETHFCGNIAFYQVTVPIPSVYCNAFCRASTEKWDAFTAIYRSQSFMPLSRMKAVETIVECKSLACKCEPFIVFPFEEYKAHLKRIAIRDEEQFDALKYSIDNIVKISTKSKSLYDQIFQSY